MNNESIIKVITQWGMMVLYGFFGGMTFIAAWMMATPNILINVGMGVTGGFMLCEAGIVCGKIFTK